VSETERLLRYALVPVEPPGALANRVERKLLALTDAAAEELAEWELRSMRDPRNWLRPVAAVVIGGAAGSTLVLVRARQRQRARDRRGVRGLGRSVREAAADVRRQLRR
jgi:hypothetical protein